MNFALMFFGFAGFAIGIEFMRTAGRCELDCPRRHRMAKRKAATTRKTTRARRRRRSGEQRELIDTGTDKRYVRRNPKGQFKESDDVGRSLSADRRQRAKSESETGSRGQGRPLGVFGSPAEAGFAARTAALPANCRGNCRAQEHHHDRITSGSCRPTRDPSSQRPTG